MCGIFGWAGKTVKQFDKAKFDIQGLYNNARGGDSCGVTTDGEIYYGITTSKNYGSFLVNSNYPKPSEIPTVIGHTRKSSSGAVNGDNAHPFGFGMNEDKFSFIGVHNGTLHNHEELAKEFNVEISLFKKTEHGNQIFDRRKIDSEVLLECIYRSKDFKVLSDYVGGAALLFTSTLEPNVLYAFRGASKLEKHGTHTLIEERPLFCYTESKYSSYFSSMPDSLVAIGGVEGETIFELEENTVYKIVNGDYENALKTKISRANSHQRPFTKYNYGVNASGWGDACGFGEEKKGAGTLFPAKKENSSVINMITAEVTDIRSEKIERFYNSPIYMQKLRYWRNGHLVSGIYTYVPKYGFKLISDDVKDVMKSTAEMIGKPFNLVLGEFGEKFPTESKNVTIPFDVDSKSIPPVIYFGEGIIFEEELDYIAWKNKTKLFTTSDLSSMSKHPIISLTDNLYSATRQNIIKKGQLFTGNISPLGSNKIYYIEGGNLIRTVLINSNKNLESDDIKVSPKDETKKMLQLTTGAEVLERNSDNELITNAYADFLNGELSEAFLARNGIDAPLENEEESFIDARIAKDAVDDLMIPIYVAIQEANNQLEEYKDNKFVRDIISENEDFLMNIDELIVNNDEKWKKK